VLIQVMEPDRLIDAAFGLAAAHGSAMPMRASLAA
jgi:hypothetical protein